MFFFKMFFVAASNWEPHEDQENYSEKHILGDEAIFGDEFIYIYNYILYFLFFWGVMVLFWTTVND